MRKASRYLCDSDQGGSNSFVSINPAGYPFADILHDIELLMDDLSLKVK